MPAISDSVTSPVTSLAGLDLPPGTARWRLLLATDAGVLLIIMVWLGFTAWLRPLAAPDEGRYVGVAWEMLRSGDWLTPMLNGLPFFHKPPLLYWITAASLDVLGLNQLAARAAPWLGATVAAFATWLFVRRWVSADAGRRALLVLLTQPLFFIGAQFANLDMLVAGCITVTIFALAHAALCLERGLPWRRVLAAAWFFAALGLLAKGLIGVVLPAMVVGLWLIAERRPRTILRLFWLPGIVLFAVVAAPWFVAMQLRFPEFLHYFFVVQHFERFSGGGFNNAQPWWFYVAVLALLTLPWSVWLPARVLAWVRTRKNVGASVDAGMTGEITHSSLQRLVVIWLVAILLFFSWPQSKLIGYILPVTAPLALLMAGTLVPAKLLARGQWLWRVTTGVAVATCLGGVALIAMYTPDSAKSLGRALAAQHPKPSEPVVFLFSYYYDLPFYARLRQPVYVMQLWSDPSITRNDNWLKEFADARQFASPAADALLVEPAALTALLCRSPVSWIAAPRVIMAGVGPNVQRVEVAGEGDHALWKVHVADCPSTPADAAGQ